MCFYCFVSIYSQQEKDLSTYKAGKQLPRGVQGTWLTYKEKKNFCTQRKGSSLPSLHY